MGDFLAALAILITVVSGLFGAIYHGYYLTLKEPDTENYKSLRNRLAGHSQREEIYRSTLTRFLRWSDRFFEGPEEEPNLPDPENLTWKDRFWQRLFFRKYADVPPPAPRDKDWQPNPWSAAAYDRCLLMAVLYPLLAVVIGWIFFGTGGELARTIGFADVSSVPNRAVFVAFIILAVAGFAVYFHAENARIGQAGFFGAFLVLISGPIVLDYLFPAGPVVGAFAVAGAFAGAVAFAVAFAGAGAVAFAVAFVGAGAFAVAFVGAFAVAFVGAGAVAFAVAVAGAFTFAGAGAVAGAKNFNRFGAFLLVLSIMQIVAIGFLLFYVGGQTESIRPFSFLVAIVILPLVNAPFDWVSTGLTRFLLRKNVSEPQPVKRALWSCLDFSGAILLLVLLCVTMVIALELTNGIAQSGGFTSTLVDVQALLTDISDHPSESRHYWLYFAVLSTLIPTFLHLATWVASTATFQSKRLSTWAVPLLDTNFAKGSADRNTLGMALTAQVMAAGLAAFLLLVAIIWLLQNLFGLGTHLLDMLLWLSGICRAWFV